MKVHALINLYNDYSTLSMAVHSIKDHVDSIIVTDGAYARYYDNYVKSVPTAKPWSTDGSLEILKAIPDIASKLHIIPPPNNEPWENQCVKRTAPLEQIPEGDWFLIIDADEMFYGDVATGLEDVQKSGCLAGSTPMYTPGLDASAFWPNWHPRVFLKLDGMHYSRKHWNIRDAQGRVIANCYPVKWVDTMVLTHLKVFRGLGRLAPHLGYMHMMALDGWMEPMKMPQYFNMDK